MANVIFLEKEALRPLVSDEESWIYIEEQDGMFFGSGGARKLSGEWVGYGSLPMNDASLELAIKAAQDWANHYNIPTIFVFATK